MNEAHIRYLLKSLLRTADTWMDVCQGGSSSGSRKYGWRQHEAPVDSGSRVGFFYSVLDLRG